MRAAFRIVLACLALQGASPMAQPQPTPANPRNGSHDFDGEHGLWSTHVKRLTRPLSGQGTWVEYDGTTRVTPILDGRANVAELRISGPAGRIEGAALRVYAPGTGGWSVHYFSAQDGEMTPPLAGAFNGERARFEGEDRLGDKAIRVRFDMLRLGPDAWRFEQSFSADGAKTWEVNWIADDRRAPAR